MRYLASTSRSFVSMWMSEARRSMAPRISESTRRTIGLSAGRVPGPRAVALVVGHELQPQPLARPARAAARRRGGAAARPPRAPRGATTASTGRPSRNSSSSSFSRSSRAPKASTRRAPSRPHGHAAEAHQQLERHLGPERGVVGRWSRGSNGRQQRLGLAARLFEVGGTEAGRGRCASDARACRPCAILAPHPEVANRYLPSQLPTTGRSPSRRRPP